MRIYKILVILLALCSSAMIGYYAWHIDFRRLYAEISIEDWANSLIAQKGVGRDCSIVTRQDINDVFANLGRNRLASDAEINLPIDCWKEMKLVELNYYADYNVVSGIYRCEKGDKLQELQLAIYLKPRTVPQESDCKVGAFPKSWDIPVGQATMFSLP